ncbi:MAG TPA: DNA mismatch repair protein MutT [Cyanobacteria bacterium UBA11049]|nr:DNA mismatch repair protein MutT [Cyanobacteria bacterium UBA11049]
MRKVKSCGVFVMRTQPQLSFLLMEKPSRYDLPKGHMEFGEDELSCALRELYEETGIEASILQLDETFRFTTSYQTRYKCFGGETVEKTVVIFLGWLKQDVQVKLSEHSGYSWLAWNPPHAIQAKIINPLLEQVEQHFHEQGFAI